jgi:predicted ATPase/class 3 adenylate cyclase
MSELRALLLTDVVDSTKLSERIGDAAMAEVWIAHDRAARDLLPSWRGREIDKTDGMLLLFESAADALGYAFAYHRALAALPVPLKARAGLHVGPVILRENPPEDVARGAKPLEVEGLAKPTTARVMSLARGGQILLTPEARAALGEVPIRMVSHGHWVMKGLAEPIELFEACDADTVPAEPPDSDKVYRVVRAGERWLPVAQLPNNLPQQATSFIGRERELDEVKALLAQARLITLLGMGGLGKTRLSLQVAAEVMPQYPDGAWFIDLTPIREAARVTDEAARVLGVAEEPGRPLVKSLCAHLKARRVLLVLDNCEQVIEPAAELVSAILSAAPDVRIIATSRETLRVPGEQVYSILPLPLPRGDDGLEALSQSTAVRLFVERAQANKPGFSISEREAPALAELVARLEGIPLALELAAARTRALSVADINARLKDRYKLLTGGSRTLQARQQTLRALVDWSYDLLNEPEKCVLGRLAVFVGGFDLAAAEAVCGAEPIDTLDVLDLLGSLVDKSLVMHEERDEGSRYRMLETIREYAREKLDRQPAEAASTAARHCEHYFAFAKAGRDGIRGADQGTWTRRLETEIDNVRAATALALSGAVDPFIAVKMAVALAQFWTLRGYVTEGRGVIRAALLLPAVQASDLARAWALHVGAGLAGSQGDYAEARSMLETCLELRRGLGNAVDIAGTLSTLGLFRLQSGDPVAAAEAEQEALQMFRALGNRLGESVSLVHLGQIAMYRSEDEQARVELRKALEVAREIGYHMTEAECELMLGQIEFESGNLGEAESRFNASLAVCRDAEDRNGEANALRWLGKLDLERGDLESARQRLGEALRAFERFETRQELVDCLEDHAALALREGNAEHAARMAGAAAQVRARMALVRSPLAERQWANLIERLNGRLTIDGFADAWSAGERLETKDAVLAALRAASSNPAVAVTA